MVDVSGAATLRRVVFRCIETAEENDTASRIVDFALIGLIIASVAAVLLESVASIEQRYSDTLAIFEAISVGAF